MPERQRLPGELRSRGGLRSRLVCRVIRFHKVAPLPPTTSHASFSRLCASGTGAVFVGPTRRTGQCRVALRERRHEMQQSSHVDIEAVLRESRAIREEATRLIRDLQLLEQLQQYGEVE